MSVQARYAEDDQGRPLAAFRFPLSSEPITVTSYYRVTAIENPWVRMMPKPGDLLYGNGWDGVLCFSGAVTLRIESKEAFRKEEPNPCPKTRLKETRYKDGRWEGLSKRKGWGPL